jgi:hypothetical protein
MTAIQCFNIPPGTIPQAEKVYKHAFQYAERHRDVLSVEVRKQIALGQVTKWACQQDDPENLARIAQIVRQAGDIVSSRYCFEDR